MASSVRDVMTSDCQCIGESDSLTDAAKRLAELDVGAMPICGDDDKLKGMLTDRDIVVKAIAQGKDLNSTTAGDLAEGKPIVIGADESVDDALSKMTENKIRRLPVIDDDRKLCGIVEPGRPGEEHRRGEGGRPGRGHLGGALVENEERSDVPEPDEAAKPAGDGDDEHSDAPGPHGTGEVYPRGNEDDAEE